MSLGPSPVRSAHRTRESRNGHELRGCGCRHSRTEAELIAGLLRSNGLEAAVSADDAGGQDPQLQILGVRVLVAPADEAAARQVIADAQTA